MDPISHLSSQVPVSAVGMLPVALTSFVGRVDELALARMLLQTPGIRLLTLTGAGGIGKTRLAIELAASLEADFPDGVCFVSLADVQQSTMVVPALASALGLRQVDVETAFDATVAAIGQSTRLLVIDNFEHVLEAAPVIARLLARCPHLQIVITSRSLLRVEGEHAIPVPSLGLPDPATPLGQDGWLQVPAIRLFIERARAVDPGYVWDRADIAILVEICGRLDGLPLALELAATRIRHLTLIEIRDRLDERLPLLVDGSRDHPSRLRTMRNAIGWSYDLLSPGAQTLFRRLAAFKGGCTIEAIEGVSAQLDPRDRADGAIRDWLAQLIDASLLLREVDPISGETRYRMLETIQEYAAAQLVESGESVITQDAHADYFTRFAERYEFADLLPAGEQAIERLIGERANLRAALTWLEQRSDTEWLFRLVAAHGNFWASTASYHEATTWYDIALARDESTPSAHRAKILVQRGMVMLLQGDFSNAEAELTEGLGVCRALDEPYYSVFALLGLATIASVQGNHEQSAGLLDECRIFAGEVADRRLAELVRGMVSLNLGVVSRAQGNSDLAAEQISDMLRRARAEDYLQGALIALNDLGDLARDRADWAGALSFYKEALQLGRTQPIKRIIIEIVESVAIVAARTSQWKRSVTLLGAAEGLRERTGLRYIQPESSNSLSLAIQENRAALGEPAFATVWETGRTCSTADTIAAALVVSDRVTAPMSAGLTPRETEIARLLVLGMTDPEIASMLFISVRTVENHVAHILAKLGVRTRTAAASAVIASGLVIPPAN